jgi:hypothetical protein
MRREYGIVLGMIGLMFLLSCAGRGANWKLLNHYDYGDGWSASQSYDTKSIVRTDEGNTRVWIRQDKEKVRKDPLEDLPFYKKLVEINCALEEVRYLRVITHLKDGDYEEEGQELDYMVPDSSKEALCQVICGEASR